MDREESRGLKTRTWILLIGILFLLSAALALWVGLSGPGGTVANIYLDGVCVRSIDLSAVTAPYSFPVETGEGTNTVTVEPGRICVSEADCPDGVCVRMGWRSDSGAPIVCLPHRLVIRIEKEAPGGFDAVAQ